MTENKLLDLSFEFAVVIVNLADGVTAPKSAYMINQLARAGTSVGANIHEAQYAQSKRDFVAKLEIALKESNETSYWLKLMYETKRIDISNGHILLTYKINAGNGMNYSYLVFEYDFEKETLEYKQLAFLDVDVLVNIIYLV